MRLRPLGAAALGCALALLCSGLGTNPASAADLNLPGIQHSDQVVLVTARDVKSTTATLSTFERTSDGWQQTAASTKVFIGRHGLVPGAQRRQSTGTTPMGTFQLNSAFGRLPDPGTKLPYIQIDHNDAWTDNPKDPSTYNLFQNANRSWDAYRGFVEHLWQLGPQYDYVVTTSFNEPTGPIVTAPDGVRRATNPTNTSRGGGIFLHVSKGEPTVGCVSMPRTVMRRIVQWLDPSKHPVVVIGLRTTLRM